MPPVCCICNDNKIEYHCKCLTCKKSVCKSCYSNIIDYDDNDNYIYKCPFCMSSNNKEMLDVDKDIICNYFKKENLGLKNECYELKSINIELKNDNISLNEEIYFLNHQKQKLLAKIQKLEDKVLDTLCEKINNTTETKPIKRKLTEYNIFIKEKSPEMRLKYPDMTPQNIMKELGKLWQIRNNNSSVL